MNPNLGSGRMRESFEKWWNQKPAEECAEAEGINRSSHMCHHHHENSAILGESSEATQKWLKVGLGVIIARSL